MKKTPITWFELPTAELARARAFYETVLSLSLRQETFGGMPMALFPYPEGGVGGALIQDPRSRPSRDGAIVYLDTRGELDACLARVAGAGGKVLLPRTDIGDPGFIALVEDTEGNRVGLHMARP
jgi:predicted enzyme related to lactoylglutathione lyase